MTINIKNRSMARIASVVFIFVICTFLMGFLLQHGLIYIFYTADVEPTFAIRYVLTLFTGLPIFGALTYCRYAFYGNYASLTVYGYFAWAFPFISPVLLWSELIPYWYLPFWDAELFSVVCGGLFVAAAIINHRRMGKKAELPEGEGAV